MLLPWGYACPRKIPGVGKSSTVRAFYTINRGMNWPRVLKHSCRSILTTKRQQACEREGRDVAKVQRLLFNVFGLSHVFRNGCPNCMLRSAFLIFLANGAGTVLSFLRNVIIGRMVSVEDFGIVSTFALAFTIIETATYAGFDRMLVQDRDGHNEKFQSNLQFLQVLRGCFGLIFFLLFAWPYAWFVGNLDIYWAYLAMSVVPLIRGFIHFDIYRVQREMRFGPTALVTVGAPLASLTVVLAFLPLVPDYRIMLIAIIAQQLIFVLLTHARANRRWQISWDREVTVRALRFGLPLLLNGLLVFAIHNGDMLLVGGFLGMDTLGWFYVATLLTITIALHLDTTVRSILLPGLSRSVDKPDEFARRAEDAVQFAAAAGMLILGFIYLFGPFLVIGLFGIKYQDALGYLIPLAVLYAIKTLKVGPNVIAVARARTMLPALTNLPRALSILIAAYLMSRGAGLPTLITIALVSETICVITAYALATRSDIGLRRSDIWLPIGALLVFVGFVVVDSLAHPMAPAVVANLRWTQLPVLLIGLGAVALLPSVRKKILGTVFGKRA